VEEERGEERGEARAGLMTWWGMRVGERKGGMRIGGNSKMMCSWRVRRAGRWAVSIGSQWTAQLMRGFKGNAHWWTSMSRPSQRR
jgi:hypothetical protein